ncbi:MAG: peptidoglycan DD-metalloendopeptidase family protein [Candidatus Marinimicrobia bacterium]|nr:peptidoglycan DD-metalloendopeptidase family protein [Candidatus Neomarinimicrobiota bacterium]MBT5956111.1 peptidoglycan DD-metalloendopeptidase family protein [Candidatus Neomarinimicrobiota bacterium]MBT6870401.1 peptidoglycan DD-metalloendopeptidase family protein [Candidatus Neomarinimicrobiota bacterium]MBT7377283.1 peptidoglycan DD-metalloendopeptidase family protein [Candidatus Neomarinimicrobiota bacterium]
MQFLFCVALLITVSFAERSSSDIQKDIDSKKDKISTLRQEIENVEKGIIKKTQEAISTTEILIDLENKITLTEKLIRSLGREERFVSSMIHDTQERIKRKKAYLNGVKEKLTLRLQHLYKHGKSSFLKTIISADNWNEAIYRIKYLDILTEHELELRQELQDALTELDVEEKKLARELTKNRRIRSDKEIENSRLETDKKRRTKYLNKVNNQKSTLENDLKQKQRIIAEIESIINKLFNDKSSMKKREDELVRIRTMQNRATSGNFAKMKGKLPWPVQGKIISRFGNQKNRKLNTITENVGIEIQATVGTPVITVLDGVISTITYIRGHGNIIIVDHGGGFSTVYAQIENIQVNENEYIQAGDRLAKIASNGKSKNGKLHFEVWGNQQKLNPEYWLTKK